MSYIIGARNVDGKCCCDSPYLGCQPVGTPIKCERCGGSVVTEPERAAQDGVALIAAERKRQIETEGWTPEHDDEHGAGQLAAAAECYVDTAALQERMKVYATPTGVHSLWPWHPRWWKPSPDPIRNLVKAGALIAAEIDRLRRKQ